MKDFGKKYIDQKVAHFGLWAEEDADVRGAGDALRVLQRAAQQTFDVDVRCEELSDAIAYLMRMNPRQPLQQFKEALDMEDPVQRYYAARNALVRVKVAMSNKR